MHTKHTILSERELRLLESLILHYGTIVTFDNIYNEMKKSISRQGCYDLISKLCRNGWLIRIKRGVYAIASLESHSFTNISPLIIAQIFLSDSYVSFEYALNHYGIFDQLPKAVNSVTPLKSKKYQFQGIDYEFTKCKKELFFGYKEVTMEGKLARIGELEKVILDYLYFRNDTYSMDLVLEKLKDAKNLIDFKKLIQFTQRYSVTVKRRLGFLLDLIGVDSTKLQREIKTKGGYSKLTKNSNIFNSKWRIYYEGRFTQ